MRLPFGLILNLNSKLSENFHGPKSATLRSCVRVYPIGRPQTLSHWGWVLYLYAADGSSRSWWLYRIPSPIL